MGTNRDYPEKEFRGALLQSVLQADPVLLSKIHPLVSVRVRAGSGLGLPHGIAKGHVEGGGLAGG